MAKSPINAQLEKAVGFHKLGKLMDAERVYDQILAVDRNNPDALNLKGIAANVQGRHGEAVGLFDRAAALMPNFADIPYNRGLALAALGRSEDALQSYLRALTINPRHSDARLNAGLLLHTSGHAREAIAAFRTMVQFAPTDARGHYNLGVCLGKLLPSAGEAERAAISQEARAALVRAESLDPKNPEVHFALGNLHSFLGEWQAAAERLKTALKLNPPWSDELRAQVLSDLGEYLRKEGDFAAAVGVHRRALELLPHDKIVRFNLALALYDNQQAEKARPIYEELLRSDPDFVKPYVNLANIYRDENRLDEALALLEESISRQPSVHAYTTMAAVFQDKGWHLSAIIVHEKANAMVEGPPVQSRYSRACTLLSMGQLAVGWPDYDLRFLIPSERTPGRPAPPPYWQGEDIRSKKLLIWTEQGIGDEAMYASMIPEMISRAGSCVLESSRRMVPVFQRSFPQATVVPRVSREAALEVAATVDVQISAASLGQYLRRDLASFPKHRGYLKSDPDKTARLRAKYLQVANGRRIVGLAWKSTRLIYGQSKSTKPADLGPILQMPGIMFVNLQYGDCADAIAEAKALFGVHIFHDVDIDPLTDLDGFFAQVAAMDLVISTSNSTVHVAGSMHIPVWLMVPWGRGVLWYWFLRREDSPWYPSMRIFRALNYDPTLPWEREPVARVAEALAEWAASPLPLGDEKLW